MRILSKAWAPALALLMLIGVVVAPAAAADYKLGAGDRIKVTVFGHEDLSGELVVSAAGGISVPLIGQVTVGGRTSGDVEKAIVGRLKPDYLKNPQVSVEVLNYRPFYIIGEVKNPGSYPYVSGMRVVNAIALAGGYTYRARSSRLQITRAESGQVGPAGHDTTVLPGDVIEVPERFF